MTIEDAIKTALEYENKVRDVYKEAAAKATSETGKKVFEVLAKEEQFHVDYLNKKLEEWKKNGHVTAETVETAIPSEAAISRGIDKLQRTAAKGDHAAEMDLLERALDMETQTSNFYKSVVDKLGAEGKALFARFVEIEEGHKAIVQAEIDYLNDNGCWFDFREFTMV